MMSSRIALLLGLVACDAPLDQRLAIIDQPRLLAITTEPAEARPGDLVTYGALVAGPDGPILTPPTWAFCTAGKPPTEDNAVAPACLGDDDVIALGAQLTVTAALPADGCRVFGPDVPDVGFRPRDPDPSGGYFQPIRADVDDLRAFGLSRITCKLPNAPSAIAQAYLTDYEPNVAPALAPLAIAQAGTPLASDAIPAGANVDLIATWPTQARESYLYYDRARVALVTRREALRVSWYATRGGLDVDASGIAEDDPATSVSTTFHAPATPGPVWLWLVLRDSRGGLATQTIELTIR
ncbi:MAG: hypothetical protein NT062_09475 [Proteobacteria bacterium]|nr:hypothetical protein [Pseudomonadota bacterium]